MTTASFSETAVKSTEASGIVLVDGVRLAQFLAFQGVAVAAEGTRFQFDGNGFRIWLDDQRTRFGPK